jgi:uncharacterized protein with HEPN domain
MKILDISILEHIISHCIDIKNDKIRFGNSFDIFSQDSAYQRLICFSIFQIGELVYHFSDNFLIEYKTRIPFRRIIDLRNRIVHGYLTINFKIIWEITKNEIPELEIFCKEKLEKLQTLQINNQSSSANTTTNPDTNPSPKFKP